MRATFVAVAAAGALLVPLPSFAHITLETTQAVTNSYFKATFSVPHGCAGSPPCNSCRIPDGVTGGNPRSPGLELATAKEKLDKPVAGDHGAAVTEIIREVSWSDGRLLDEHFAQIAMKIEAAECAEHDALLPGRAGVRAGGNALDRDPGGGQVVARL